MSRLLTGRRFYFLLTIILGYFLYSVAFAGGLAGDKSAAGGDEVSDVLLGLIIIILAAKLGGDLLEQVKQPAVLGELIFGMLIGNLHLLGIDFLEPMKQSHTLEILAELGVILLLFEVGLESSLGEMMKVGATSLLVALFGVVAPFFLGWGVGLLFLPEESLYVHIFIGATLTATSVGITARVLKDINRIQSREAKIILGAAVIDDILGLIILAVVVGIISAANAGTGGIDSFQIFLIIAKAVLFVLGAVIVGGKLVPRILRAALRLKVAGVLLSIALMVCFALAYLADIIGLAPIVGAFAAGLILEDIHYREYRERGEHEIKELINPIGLFLIPVFFVKMGMVVDLTTFYNTDILLFAAVMTLAAIAGKQVCSLAVFDRSVNRFAIGLGMIPRGEVGLIFAGIGAKLMIDGHNVISAGTYSAIVIMVIVTTLVTPPLLKTAMVKSKE
jgi:Kef-type K+ transport system membrane component KefB